MLLELHVQNVALIDELRLEFGPGLHVLSGETGAGKSIVLGALGLILGGRADQNLIRTGTKEAVVEAIFALDATSSLRKTLEEAGLPVDEELLVRRVVPRSGRNRIHVNGSPVTASLLRRLCRGLVDFSSQHEQQILLDANQHLNILDAFADHPGLLETMANKAKSFKKAHMALMEILNAKEGRAQREAFLHFQIKELDEVDPTEGEDEALEAEHRRLAHSEKLHEYAAFAEERLYGGSQAVVDVLSEVLVKVEAIGEIDPSVATWVSEIRTALLSVEDVGRSLGTYAQTLEHDPNRLEEINVRLTELKAIKRKYQLTLTEILVKRDEMRRELSTLENFDHEITLAQKKLDGVKGAAKKAAAKLRASRMKAAKRLRSEVEKELSTLSMGRARFEVHLDEKKGECVIGPLGNDRVSFFLAANPGEPAQAIHRVASGGELSRILLAIKVALAGAGDVSTFIFDEIDSGIGGATAEVVGQKLGRIAEGNQVICITHLPQIAAYGGRHYNVIKSVSGERTRTTVVELGAEERLQEMARMLGGLSITAHTLAHAQEMISRGQSFGT